MTENSLFIDPYTLKYKVNNKTKGRLRIYLGEFIDDEFTVTINSISDLDESVQKKLKNTIKSIITAKSTIIL